MGQWGATRHFLTDGHRTSVIADVYTGDRPFNPLRNESTIADLVLVHVDNTAAAKRLLAELKQKWIGRPHGDWKKVGPGGPHASLADR